MKLKVLLLIILVILSYSRLLRRSKTKQGDTYIFKGIETYITDMENYKTFYIFCKDDNLKEYNNLFTNLSFDKNKNLLEDTKESIENLSICLFNLKTSEKKAFKFSEIVSFTYSLDEGVWKIQTISESYDVHNRFNNIILDLASEILGLNCYVACLHHFKFIGQTKSEIAQSLEKIYNSLNYINLIHKYYNAIEIIPYLNSSQNIKALEELLKSLGELDKVKNSYQNKKALENLSALLTKPDINGDQIETALNNLVRLLNGPDINPHSGKKLKRFQNDLKILSTLLEDANTFESLSSLSDMQDIINRSNKIKSALNHVAGISGKTDPDSHFGKNIELKTIITPGNLEILKRIFKQKIYKPDVYISMIESFDMVEDIFGLEKDLAHHLKSITSNPSLVKFFTEGLHSVEKFKTLQEALLLKSDELKFLLRWTRGDICKNSDGKMITVKEILTIFDKIKKNLDFETFKNDNNPSLDIYKFFKDQNELVCMKELTGLSDFKEDIKEPGLVKEEKDLFVFLNQMRDKDVGFIKPLSSLLWFLNPSKYDLEGYTSNPYDIESRLETIRDVFTHKTLIELVKSEDSVQALNRFLFFPDYVECIERIFNRISHESLEDIYPPFNKETFPEFDLESTLIKDILDLNGKEIKDLAKIINYLSEKDGFSGFNDAAKILMSEISDKITFNEVLLLYRISKSSHSETFLKQMETYTKQGNLVSYMEAFPMSIMNSYGDDEKLILLNNRIKILMGHFVVGNLEETVKPYIGANEQRLKEEIELGRTRANNHPEDSKLIHYDNK
jgi:hypothetical protein